MRRLSICHLVMWSALAVGPLMVSVQPASAGEVVHRYYDREHRDYHVWNNGERRAYREYLNARHRRYVEYRRLTAAERRAYWNWRHERIERERHER